MDSNTAATAKLPSDIINEILLRLPTRSIGKFRSVCKLFNQLSTTSDFISAHTQLCRQNPQPRPALLALSVASRDPSTVYIVRARVRDNLETIELNLFPFPSLGSSRIGVEGSCDGLLCFRPTKTSLVFLNPLTRRYSLIHVPLMNTCQVLGFYYHMHSKTYRLLLMQQKYDQMEYCVFTIGPNTLAIQENHTPCDVYRYIYQFPPILVNNAFYCMATRKDSRQPSWDALLVFNTETGQFTHVPLPDYRGSPTLLEIHGKVCICVINVDTGRQEFDVKLWVLKDEIKGIWIKKQNVSVEDLQGHEDNCTIVASVARYCHYFLAVKSESSDDITSPEERFTFFSFIGDKTTRFFGPSDCFPFRETLTSMGIYLQCDEETYLSGHASSA